MFFTVRKKKVLLRTAYSKVLWGTQNGSLWHLYVNPLFETLYLKVYGVLGMTKQLFTTGWFPQYVLLF